MGFGELHVTTLAGTPERYERTHPGTGGEMLTRIRESLRHLADRKAAARSRHPRVWIMCVVVSENVDGIADLARFAEEVSADRICLLPLDDVGDPGLARLVISEAQAASLARELPVLARRMEGAGIAHNFEGFLRVCRDRLDTRRLYRIIPCHYVWVNSRVHVDGNVYPCCRCYEPMGNVHERRFREIWHGPRYRELRRRAAALPRGNGPVPGCDCDSCPHHAANQRIYRALHPIRGRSVRLTSLRPPESGREA
jgi:radical SAM protein with 4Fe4S-binding SPASM domain